MRILVTRPLEDGAEIAARLAEMGHAALLAPLLEPQFESGPEPDFSGVQAVLATSANGVRALVRRTARRDLPIFAVGPQTEREAREAGFADVRSADGDAVALVAKTADWTAPDRGVLLHVCGAEAPGTLQNGLAARGFDVRRAVLYRVQAADALPPAIARALADDAVDAALFFSPRSARVFAALARDLPTQRLIAACISPVTAAALDGQSFAEVRVAARPNQDALLATIA
jgi:uroporphyrinogen-III synthase